MKTEIAILKELLRQAKASHAIRNFTLSIDTNTAQSETIDGRVLNSHSGVRRIELSMELAGTRSETISGESVGNGLGVDKISAESDSVATTTQPIRKGNFSEWMGAPRWAMFRAQESSGLRAWFEKRPIPIGDFWGSTERGFYAIESSHLKPNPDWRNTLEARP